MKKFCTKFGVIFVGQILFLRRAPQKIGMSQDRKLKIVWTLKDVTCHSHLIYDYAKVKVSTIADLKIDLVSLFVFFFFWFVLARGVGGSINGNPIIEIN